MTENFNDILAILADNDGACLYWQMPSTISRNHFKSAAETGAVRLEGDLLVHPLAIEIEKGMAYIMPKTIDDLIEAYKIWNNTNGLDLGSADEHLFDENLTEQQRSWLWAFSQYWETVARKEQSR